MLVVGEQKTVHVPMLAIYGTAVTGVLKKGGM